MLRVPWSKVTSIGDKVLQVLRVLGIFKGSILRDTARTRSISGMIALYTACTRSILGFDTRKYCCTPSILALITLEYSLYLKYLRSLLWNTRCTWSIWGSCAAPTLSTPSTWAFHTTKILILGVFQGFIFRGSSKTRSRFYTPRSSGLEYYSEYFARMKKYSWVQYSQYSDYSK